MPHPVAVNEDAGSYDRPLDIGLEVCKFWCQNSCISWAYIV
jgi:hypothetical protein